MTLPSLGRSRRDPLSRQELERALAAGPWCWPIGGEWLRRAAEIVPSGPGTLCPGQTLLATDSENCAALWSFRVGDPEPPFADAAVELGSVARRAWDAVAVALPRTLPVLWRPVARARGERLTAVRLCGLTHPGRAEVVERIIDGPSFGLAFALALASRVLGVPLREDVVASAALTVTGRTAGVDGISAKVRAVVECAPRVRLFLVAPENAAEGQEAAHGSGLTVQAVGSAAAAIEAGLGEPLADRLVRDGRDPVHRAELVDAFFRLALAGRSQVVEWGPVRRAAELAMTAWSDVSPEDRRRLEFSRAVAARHENNEGELPPAEDSWLSRLPAPVRVGIAAHYVQQAADAGSPSADVAEALARRYLVPSPEAFSPHRKLQGALGRLLAVTGHAEEALALQESAAVGFFDSLEYSEVSFPLTEWYRLSGVLRDREAFARAEALRERTEQQGGLGIDGSPYVELARSRALVLLGDSGQGSAERTLSRLAGDERIPSHIRLSALRWLVRLFDESGRPAEADRALGLLEAAASDEAGDVRRARRYLALVRLDRAVRSGDLSAAQQPLDELAALQSGVVGHLLAASAPRAAAFVAEHFPY